MRPTSQALRIQAPRILAPRSLGPRILVCCVVLAGMIAALSARSAVAQTTDVEWAGPVDGTWSDATKWNGGVVPNANGTERYSGVINANAPADGSYEVTIDSDLDLIEIRLTAQRARVIHSGGRVTAEIITATGDNYILQGGTIAGATLNSERTPLERGRFVVFGDDPSSLSNVALNSALYIGGTTSTTEITGPGTLRFAGGLQFQRAGRGIQFQGGGGEVIGVGDQMINANSPLAQIAFGQNADASARLASDNGMLTIGSNMLVRTFSSGQSFLGRDGTGLLNQGIIRADRGLESLTIEGDWSNTGRMEASDGGTLNLGGQFTTAGMGQWSSQTNGGGGIAITGNLDNSAAILDLTRNEINGIGGTLMLRGGQITGGLVRSSGPASQLMSESMSGTAGTLDGVTLEGDIEITLGVTRIRNGLTLQNQAGQDQTGLNVRRTSPTLQTIIEVDGTQTIGGNGTLNFNQGAAAMTLTAGTTLTLGEGITVQDIGGSFAIGSRNASLVNLGAILATSDTMIAGDTITNRGLISTSPGAIVSIDAGAFTNAGILAGNGSFHGGEVLNEGVIRPGASPGTLLFDSLSQSSMGILEFEIGGLVPGIQHDQVLVDNQFRLAGIIDVNLIDGFAPLAGDAFTLMAWNSIAAADFQFDFFDAALTDGLAWNTGQFTGTGQITVVAVPEPTTLLSALGIVGVGVWRRKRRTERRDSV